MTGASAPIRLIQTSAKDASTPSKDEALNHKHLPAPKRLAIHVPLKLWSGGGGSNSACGYAQAGPIHNKLQCSKFEILKQSCFAHWDLEFRIWDFRLKSGSRLRLWHKNEAKILGPSDRCLLYSLSGSMVQISCPAEAEPQSKSRGDPLFLQPCPRQEYGRGLWNLRGREGGDRVHHLHRGFVDRHRQHSVSL